MARREYEMTEEQLERLLQASRPMPYIIVGGRAPLSAQEVANMTWRSLGDELGFEYMTVEPVPGKSQHFFTAEPTKGNEMTTSNEGNATTPGDPTADPTLHGTTPSAKSVKEAPPDPVRGRKVCDIEAKQLVGEPGEWFRMPENVGGSGIISATARAGWKAEITTRTVDGKRTVYARATSPLG